MYVISVSFQLYKQLLSIHVRMKRHSFSTGTFIRCTLAVITNYTL
nr:unnamed protein product [Callosobruchus chinensis]